MEGLQGANPGSPSLWTGVFGEELTGLAPALDTSLAWAWPHGVPDGLPLDYSLEAREEAPRANKGGVALKGNRLRWTLELHTKFTAACNELGGPNHATPKQILTRMGVPGMTLFHVKSHLQKFRQALKEGRKPGVEFSGGAGGRQPRQRRSRAADPDPELQGSGSSTDDEVAAFGSAPQGCSSQAEGLDPPRPEGASAPAVRAPATAGGPPPAWPGDAQNPSRQLGRGACQPAVSPAGAVALSANPSSTAGFLGLLAGGQGQPQQAQQLLPEQAPAAEEQRQPGGQKQRQGAGMGAEAAAPGGAGQGEEAPAPGSGAGGELTCCGGEAPAPCDCGRTQRRRRMEGAPLPRRHGRLVRDEDRPQQGDSRAERGKRMEEALAMQMELQRQLQEALEAQHDLQRKLLAHGQFIQSLLTQETAGVAGLRSGDTRQPVGDSPRAHGSTPAAAAAAAAAAAPTPATSVSTKGQRLADSHPPQGASSPAGAKQASMGPSRGSGGPSKRVKTSHQRKDAGGIGGSRLKRTFSAGQPGAALAPGATTGTAGLMPLPSGLLPLALGPQQAQQGMTEQHAQQAQQAVVVQLASQPGVLPAGSGEVALLAPALGGLPPHVSLLSKQQQEQQAPEHAGALHGLSTTVTSGVGVDPTITLARLAHGMPIHRLELAAVLGPGSPLSEEQKEHLMATLNHQQQQQQALWLPAPPMQEQPSLTSANSSGGCLGNPLPSVEMPLPPVRPPQQAQQQQQPGREAEGEASLVKAASPLSPRAGSGTITTGPCSSPSVSRPQLPPQPSLQSSHGSPAVAPQRSVPPPAPIPFVPTGCGQVGLRDAIAGRGGCVGRASSLPCPVSSPFLGGMMQRSATHPGQLPGGVAGASYGLAVPAVPASALPAHGQAVAGGAMWPLGLGGTAGGTGHSMPSMPAPAGQLGDGSQLVVASGDWGALGLEGLEFIAGSIELDDLLLSGTDLL